MAMRNGLHVIRGSPPSSYYTMNVDGDVYLHSGQRISVWVESWDDNDYTIHSESGFSAYLAASGADGDPSLWKEISDWRTSGKLGLLDEGNNFDESSGRFTAPSSGYYHMSANVRLDGNGGSYTRLCACINGICDLNNGLAAITANPVNSYYSSSIAGTSHHGANH